MIVKNKYQTVLWSMTRYNHSDFIRLETGSLLWELESSEKPNCAEKSEGPWESLTIEKPKNYINFLINSYTFILIK